MPVDVATRGLQVLVAQVRGDGRDAAAPVGDARAAGLAEHVRAMPGQLALLDELLHPALDGVLLVVLAAVGREHEGAACRGSTWSPRAVPRWSRGRGRAGGRAGSWSRDSCRIDPIPMMDVRHLAPPRLPGGPRRPLRPIRRSPLRPPRRPRRRLLRPQLSPTPRPPPRRRDLRVRSRGRVVLPEVLPDRHPRPGLCHAATCPGAGSKVDPPNCDADLAVAGLRP